MKIYIASGMYIGVLLFASLLSICLKCAIRRWPTLKKWYEVKKGGQSTPVMPLHETNTTIASPGIKHSCSPKMLWLWATSKWQISPQCMTAWTGIKTLGQSDRASFKSHKHTPMPHTIQNGLFPGPRLYTKVYWSHQKDGVWNSLLDLCRHAVHVVDRCNFGTHCWSRQFMSFDLKDTYFHISISSVNIPIQEMVSYRGYQQVVHCYTLF